MSSLLKSVSQKNNIAVLDGVRAVACFLVIGYHLDLITKDLHAWSYGIGPLATSIAMMGKTGVTLFFVLSGFLLFMSYVRAILFEKEWPVAQKFYLRRIFRIWPGYFVSLVVLILWQHQEYLQGKSWRELVLFTTFFMDSSHRTYQQLNGPFWTLAVEWQFYLFLPVLALVCAWIVKCFAHLGRNSLRSRWCTLVGCLLVLFSWGLFSRYWGSYFMGHPDQTVLVPRRVLNVILFFVYGSSGKYMEDFAVGMLISSCFILLQESNAGQRIVQLREGIQYRSLYIWGLGILLLTFMAVWDFHHWEFQSSSHLLNNINQEYYWISEAGFAISYGLCVLAILFGPQGLRMMFEWAPLRSLGFISYGLYIWHLPILLELQTLLGDSPLHWGHLLVYGLFWLCVILVIVPFAYLFYRVIELPWIEIGKRLLQKREKYHTLRSYE